jgi:signal peptidase I
MAESQLTVAVKPSATAGIKDTIESILLAFILAFVFRAFVVEAFVIPTGSMATTLLGAHTRFHCPDCGYDFDVNFQPRRTSADPEAEDPAIPPVGDPISDPVYCPNCGCQMPQSQTQKPPVFYGDRILVLKYLYQLQEPKRYDVVVFKAPISYETNYTTNYIKRLIGKPGEAVMVIDGDVYIRSPDAKNAGDFVIQPKTKVVQDAVWRLVYDNDFHASHEGDSLDNDLLRGKAKPWKQPWRIVDGPVTDKTGWNLSDAQTNGRTFTFIGDNASSRLRFDPQANPTAQSTSDYLVYDQQPQPGQIPVRSVNSRFPIFPTESNGSEIPVSDLDLRLTYQRVAGSGPVHLSLTKRNHIFTAEITPTQVTLFQDFDGRRTTLGQPLAISGNRPMRIELSNADYQVILRIDGAIAAQSTPADFAPNLPALIREFEENRTPPPGNVEIEASDQRCKVSHLSLWRDDYYYNHGNGVLRATPRDFPNNAVVLKPEEYFVMGDNSILSYDARCWDRGVKLPAEDIDVEAGRVPARFMLGKAFYVYWPAGYLVYPGLPAFVPNFGAMRFIH